MNHVTCDEFMNFFYVQLIIYKVIIFVLGKVKRI